MFDCFLFLFLSWTHLFSSILTHNDSHELLLIIFPCIQADEEEGEFDSDAELNALGGVGGLGEGEFLTAEERAAYLDASRRRTRKRRVNR